LISLQKMGFTIDIGMEGYKSIISDILRGPVNYAWAIFDKDIVDIGRENYEDLQKGTVERVDLLRYPRAKYHIQWENKSAKVYASFWTKLSTIYLIYHLQEIDGSWTIIQIDSM